MTLRLLLGIVLAGATAVVYAPVVGFSFVSLDDPLYVTGNEWVLRGLDAQSIRWAFTSSIGANWLPMTFLSHMLDVSWFGLDPAGHHITNVVLHIAAVSVLFAVWVSMTGRVGRSAVIAGLFALHPMHVESVAWVTERKDVLSGLFAFLTLAAYLGYVRRGGVARYALVAGLLALGLMSKAMLVTLPLVLLLLDVWPLGRIDASTGSALARRLASWGGAERPGVYRPESLGWLVREKLPLLALVAAASVVTFAVQQEGGAMVVAGEVPLPERLANAAYSYARYIEQSFWPRGLSVSVPHPYLVHAGGQGLSPFQLGSSLVLLVCVAGVALRRGGAIGIGMAWFVGMLVPVIGFVQVGPQGMADRYSYLPSVGLSVAIVWPVAHWVEQQSRNVRVGAVVVTVVLLAGLALQTSRQLERWRGSVPLFEHALAVNGNNLSARFGLALVYRSSDRVDEAIEQYLRILQQRPDSARAHNGLGVTLLKSGRAAAARSQFERALALQPKLGLAHLNLGRALFELGELPLAESAFREALRYNAYNGYDGHDARAARPLRHLARVLRAEGRRQEALEHLQAALAFDPRAARTHRETAELLIELGRPGEAAAHYRRVIELRPGDPDARAALRRLEAEIKVMPEAG